MKKLLRVIPSMNPASGGPVQGIKNSIPWLAGHGWISEAVTLDSPEDSWVAESEIRTHAMGPCFSPFRYAPKFLPWLYRNLHEFDAVTIHGLWLWPSLATWIAIQSLGGKAMWLTTKSVSPAQIPPNDQLPIPKIPPYFVMPHGMLDPWFQEAPGRRLKALRNTAYWKLFEFRVIRDADALLFTCEQEKVLAGRTFHPYSPKKEVVIGYGADDPPQRSEEMDASFRRRVPLLPPSRPYLLYLGRIDSKKGVDLLVSAYARILRRNDGHSSEQNLPHLVIAGPGKETAFGSRILRLVNDLGLAHFIHFPGMLTGNPKWGALYGSDAFVLCSHQENFGIAVAEALSCGKPVLISDKVNIWNEIVTAEAGYAAEDSESGAEDLLLRWVLTPASRRMEMGKAAFRLFRTGLHAKFAANNLNIILESSSRN